MKDCVLGAAPLTLVKDSGVLSSPTWFIAADGNGCAVKTGFAAVVGIDETRMPPPPASNALAEAAPGEEERRGADGRDVVKGDFVTLGPSESMVAARFRYGRCDAENGKRELSGSKE